jgi:hypothetical protein
VKNNTSYCDIDIRIKLFLYLNGEEIGINLCLQNIYTDPTKLQNILREIKS